MDHMGTPWAVAFAGVAMLGILLLSAAALAFVYRGVIDRPAESLQTRIAALESKVAALPSLWESELLQAESILKNARSEHARARAARSAAARRGESDGEPDASEDVRGNDARTGGVQGVLPLPSSVAPVPPTEPEYLARARAVGYPYAFLRS